MGLKAWLSGGRRQVIASRSFLFPDRSSAKAFEASMLSGYSRRQGLIGFLGSTSMAARYGGTLFRSTSAREQRVYGYQATVSAQDREYLLHRDPTASMFVEKPPTDLWNGFPLTYVPQVDAYFSQQIALGLLSAFQASYQEYFQEGGGFVLLEASGNPETRLKRGERPLAWTFIPAGHVLDDDNPDTGFILAQPDNTDPLLDHGIEYLWLYPTAEAKAANRPVRVHGSRLIPVNLDPRHQKWWRTPNVPLHRIYDTLWELRDIIFSRTRAHFQGDPIVVDVDISKEANDLLNFAEMTQTERDELSMDVEQSIVDYNSGAKTSFAPVMGFKMRRLGAAQLPDPKEDVMMLSSRLAHGSVFPVKMVLASTKGASDIGDQDILIYAGNIQNIRNTWGYKHLAKALLMGQVMGANGLRMQGEHDLPSPQDLVWPLLRPLSPRDAAFTEKTDSAIARALQEASLQLPARLKRKFPEDPRYPIPLWLASRGRDTDGNSMDPPAPAGGKATASAGAQADIEAVQERVKTLEERLEEELEVAVRQESTAT